jgi:hypothetical protein
MRRPRDVAIDRTGSDGEIGTAEAAHAEQNQAWVALFDPPTAEGMGPWVASTRVIL